MPPPHTTVKRCGETRLHVICLYPVSMHASVHPSRMLFLWHLWCHWYALMDFPKLLSAVHLGTEINWLVFGVRRSKVSVIRWKHKKFYCETVNMRKMKCFVRRCRRLFNGWRSGIVESHWEAGQAQICDWFTGFWARHRTGLHKTGSCTSVIIDIFHISRLSNLMNLCRGSREIDDEVCVK